MSIISLPCVNSKWSCSLEMATWGHDLFDLDLWPWPFAWISHLSMVITPEKFRMIWWEEHCQKGVTDGQTDEKSVLRAAWLQLKMNPAVTLFLQNRQESELWSILALYRLKKDHEIWPCGPTVYTLLNVVPMSLKRLFRVNPVDTFCKIDENLNLTNFVLIQIQKW